MSGVVVVALYAVPFLFGNVMYGRDLTLCDIGLICAVKQHLATGQSLWVSPFVGNGVPLLLAPEAQLFSPIRWMTLFLPADWAASVGIVLYLSLAASAMCALVLSFRVRPVIASFAGICFAFVGPIIDLTFHGMYIIGAVVLPLAWVGARLTCRRPFHARGPLIVTAAVAFALLGGEPQAAGIAIALVLLESSWATRFSRRRIQHLLPIGTALFAGVLIGFFPWWGTLAEMTLTGRSSALDLDRALKWSVGPREWIGMFLPGLTQESHPVDVIIAAHLFGKIDTWVQEPYLGAPLLALVVVGAVVRRARVAWMAVVTGALVSLGPLTPVLPVLMKLVPPLGSFRYPAKYLVVTTVAFIVVAACGAETFATARARRAMPRGPLTILLAVNAAVLLVVFAIAFTAMARAQGGPDALVRAVLEERLTAAVGITILLGLIAARARTRAHAIMAVVFLDLIVATYQIVETGPPVVDAPSIADLMKPVNADETIVLCQDADAKDNVYAGGEGLRWHQALFVRKWHAPEMQACDGVSSAASYTVMNTRTHMMLQSLVDAGVASASRALGCDYLLTGRSTDAAEERAVYHDDIGAFPVPTVLSSESRAQKELRILVVDDARPTLTVARDPQLFDDEETAVIAVVESESARAMSAMVDDPMHRLHGMPLPDGNGITSSVIDAHDSDEAVITLEGTGGGVVVWNRAFAVGWRATQDDADLPVLRASGVSLAVVVSDAARGPVTLRYRMPRLFWALASTGVGLGLALMLAFHGMRRRSMVASRATAVGPL